MNILLIAPLDPQVPVHLEQLMGGESTYTKMLLQFPPRGIIFTHLDEALKKGWASVHPLQTILLWLQRFRILPLGPRVYIVKLREDFDLVYAHTHPIKMIGKKIPLVISDSSSNLVFLEKYLEWPKWRIQLVQLVKLVIFKLFGVVDGEVNTDKANAVFVFSKWAKRIKNLEFRIKNVNVIYPGLPVPGEKKIREKGKKKIRLLFVGVWFERKGEQFFLKCFENYDKRTLTYHSPF